MTKETKTDVDNLERDEKIQRYELVYLISNKFSENELEPITKDITKLIKDNGGEIITEENWGKKKLAYPIKKFFHAYYFLLEINLPTKSLEKIEKHLRLSEEVLRHLIVKKRTKTEKEIEHEKKIAVKIAAAQKEEKKQTEEKITEKKKPAAKKKVASMEELDEKLEGILDDTDKLL